MTQFLTPSMGLFKITNHMKRLRPPYTPTPRAPRMAQTEVEPRTSRWQVIKAQHTRLGLKGGGVARTHCVAHK